LYLVSKKFTAVGLPPQFLLFQTTTLSNRVCDVHFAPPAEHCHNTKNTTFQERGKTTGDTSSLSQQLRWSSGWHAGLWYPSSRFQTRPKPSDFFGRKNPQHVFLQKGSKAVCPMSQICSMLKNPVITWKLCHRQNLLAISCLISSLANRGL
jgi:hypothetical protein